MQSEVLTVQTLIAKIRVNQKLLSICLALHALIRDHKSILPLTHTYLRMELSEPPFTAAGAKQTDTGTGFNVCSLSSNF